MGNQQSSSKGDGKSKGVLNASKGTTNHEPTDIQPAPVPITEKSKSNFGKLGSVFEKKNLLTNLTGKKNKDLVVIPKSPVGDGEPGRVTSKTEMQSNEGTEQTIQKTEPQSDSLTSGAPAAIQMTPTKEYTVPVHSFSRRNLFPPFNQNKLKTIDQINTVTIGKITFPTITAGDHMLERPVSNADKALTWENRNEYSSDRERKKPLLLESTNVLSKSKPGENKPVNIECVHKKDSGEVREKEVRPSVDQGLQNDRAQTLQVEQESLSEIHVCPDTISMVEVEVRPESPVNQNGCGATLSKLASRMKDSIVGATTQHPSVSEENELKERAEHDQSIDEHQKRLQRLERRRAKMIRHNTSNVNTEEPWMFYRLDLKSTVINKSSQCLDLETVRDGNSESGIKWENIIEKPYIKAHGRRAVQVLTEGTQAEVVGLSDDIEKDCDNSTTEDTRESETVQDSDDEKVTINFYNPNVAARVFKFRGKPENLKEEKEPPAENPPPAVKEFPKKFKEDVWPGTITNPIAKEDRSGSKTTVTTDGQRESKTKMTTEESMESKTKVTTEENNCIESKTEVTVSDLLQIKDFVQIRDREQKPKKEKRSPSPERENPELEQKSDSPCNAVDKKIIRTKRRYPTSTVSLKHGSVILVDRILDEVVQQRLSGYCWRATMDGNRDVSLVFEFRNFIMNRSDSAKRSMKWHLFSNDIQWQVDSDMATLRTFNASLATRLGDLQEHGLNILKALLQGIYIIPNKQYRNADDPLEESTSDILSSSRTKLKDIIDIHVPVKKLISYDPKNLADDDYLVIQNSKRSLQTNIHQLIGQCEDQYKVLHKEIIKYASSELPWNKYSTEQLFVSANKRLEMIQKRLLSKAGPYMRKERGIPKLIQGYVSSDDELEMPSLPEGRNGKRKVKDTKAPLKGDHSRTEGRERGASVGRRRSKSTSEPNPQSQSAREEKSTTGATEEPAANNTLEQSISNNLLKLEELCGETTDAIDMAICRTLKKAFERKFGEEKSIDDVAQDYLFRPEKFKTSVTPAILRTTKFWVNRKLSEPQEAMQLLDTFGGADQIRLANRYMTKLKLYNEQFIKEAEKKAAAERAKAAGDRAIPSKDKAGKKKCKINDQQMKTTVNEKTTGVKETGPPKVFYDNFVQGSYDDYSIKGKKGTRGSVEFTANPKKRRNMPSASFSCNVPKFQQPKKFGKGRGGKWNKIAEEADDPDLWRVGKGKSKKKQEKKNKFAQHGVSKQVKQEEAEQQKKAAEPTPQKNAKTPQKEVQKSLPSKSKAKQPTKKSQANTTGKQDDRHIHCEHFAIHKDGSETELVKMQPLKEVMPDDIAHNF